MKACLSLEYKEGEGTNSNLMERIEGRGKGREGLITEEEMEDKEENLLEENQELERMELKGVEGEVERMEGSQRRLER